MTPKDSTFTLSVTTSRKVKVVYRIEAGIHYFTSPDVIGGAYYHRDRTKAYEGFVKLLKERVK